MADEKAEEKKEEKKEDSARKDEHIDVATEKTGGQSGGQTLDKMLSKLDDCMKKMDAVADSLGKRMDAVDARMDSMTKGDKKDAAKPDAEEKKEEKADAKKDAEPGEAKEVVADKKRKDDDDARKDKKRDDAVADDDEVRKAIAELAKKIPGIEARLPQSLSDSDRNALSDAQARADNAFAQFGERAPHPQIGEKPHEYRRRLFGLLKKHSKTWKDIPEAAVADSAAFEVAEQQVYADAIAAANSGDGVPEGMLREVTRVMTNGSKETRFIGHPSAWMNNFIPTRRALTKLAKPQSMGG